MVWYLALCKPWCEMFFAWYWVLIALIAWTRLVRSVEDLEFRVMCVPYFLLTEISFMLTKVKELFWPKKQGFRPKKWNFDCMFQLAVRQQSIGHKHINGEVLLLFVTKQNSRDLLTAHMFYGLYLLKIAIFLDNHLKIWTGLHNVILVMLEIYMGRMALVTVLPFIWCFVLVLQILPD